MVKSYSGSKIRLQGSGFGVDLDKQTERQIGEINQGGQAAHTRSAVPSEGSEDNDDMSSRPDPFNSSETPSSSAPSMSSTS